MAFVYTSPMGFHFGLYIFCDVYQLDRALPKVAMPTGPGENLAQLLSTPDFEDETHMIEWLVWLLRSAFCL
jgi:hypothetical protein